MRFPDNIIVVDLIEAVVEELRGGSDIIDVVGTGPYTVNTTQTNGFTLANKDMPSKSLSNGDEVVINSIEYIVSNVTDTSFDITGADPTGQTVWQKTAPYYYHGSPIAVDKERTSDITELKSKKYPFVGLFEAITEQKSYKPNVRISSNAEIWIVFMKYNKDNNVDNSYDNAVREMIALSDDFLKVIVNNSGIFGELETVIQKNYAQWGIEAKFMGVTKRILPEDLAGVELNFDLPIKRKEIC